MAIAFQPEWTESERVVDAALIGYSVVGAVAKPVALGTLLDKPIPMAVGGLLCAVVTDPRTVEVVVDELFHPVSLRNAIDSLVGQEWDVTVLVPLDAVGVAHVLLRGVPCNLQPWWEDYGQILFGGYEVP
jgi:hypothetical protein